VLKETASFTVTVGSTSAVTVPEDTASSVPYRPSARFWLLAQLSVSATLALLPFCRRAAVRRLPE
jgi:hypothetical protein